MDGLSAAELTLIRHLAGNDALLRKKTIKKLKTWLSARAARVLDTPDCRELIGDNFLRVWKALFYCMWMADKPLPQEQLAEQISSLIDIFSSKPHVMNLFIEWFFRTMAREWQWIDRFRMDKFMMLVRRFLRKSLEALSKRQWKLEALDGFLNIITVVIFNHHPEIQKTQSKTSVPSPEISPLGLQIHIVDIFLEEVSKIGGHRLKSKKILKLLKPFIHELSTNDDERILNEIRERIFCHLMKQSDVGIDYAEGGGMEEGTSEEEDEPVATTPLKDKNNKSKRDEDSDSDFNDEEGEHTEQLSGPLDPRAGVVDVILPQLEIDYSTLAERLTKVGGWKTVKSKNRKILYNLARQFQRLTAGEYPLAIDLQEPKPALGQKVIQEAAKRLVKMDDSMGNPDKKKRPTKKMRKKLGKERLLQSMKQTDFDTGKENSTDGEGIEKENEGQLDKEETRVDDEEDQSDEETLDEVEDEKVDFNLSGDEDDEEDREDLTQVENLLVRDETDSKQIKNTKLGASSTQLQVKRNNNINLGNKKQKMDSSLTNLNVGNSQEGPTNSPATTTLAEGAIKLNSTPLSNAILTTPNDDEGQKNGDIFLNISTPRPSKKRKMNDSVLFTPDVMSSPGASKRKRVSFGLDRNLQHEHSDYADSIQRSPAIPFDSLKKPNHGLLKSLKFPVTPSSLTNMPVMSRIACRTRRASGRF